MHLTKVLYRHHYGRYIKRMWLRFGKFTFEPIKIPPELQAMGVKIHDALDVAKDRHIGTPDPQQFDILLSSDGHPLKKYYLFDNKVRISENENILLALLKTVSYNGLPNVLQSLIGVDKLENQDQIIKNCINQAIVLDAHLHKLPKKVDVKKPGYVWPREYGSRHKRKACNLVQKLALLAEMKCGKYPGSLERLRNIDAFTEVIIKRDGDTVIFQLNSNIAITSKTPLRPFATEEEVLSTKNMQLPSIYPVRPTLDLWQSESNPSKHFGPDQLDTTGFWNDRHIHTLHVVHETFGFWFPEQKLCRAIATCFTFATEEARKLYGDDVLELPYPVSVQCIYSDTVNFGVVAFQLNTLDLSHDEGLKNQVWIQPAKSLYTEADQMLGIQGYNPEVFEDITAVYLNGLHHSTL